MKKTSPELVPRIVSLYQEGRGVSDIAGVMGLSDTTIRKYLKAAGVYDPHRIPPELVPRIVSLYQEGRGVSDIAGLVGYAPGNVRARLKAAGVWVRGRRPFMPDLSARIVSLYQKGRGVSDIAGLVGYTPATVRAKLRAAGVKVTPGNVRAKDVQRMIALWGNGESLKRVAYLTGFDRTTVRKYLKAAGVYEAGRRVSGAAAEDVQRIVSLYQEGRGVSGVADRTGYSRATVRDSLRAAGVRLTGDPPGAEDVQRMVSLKLSGYKLTCIADMTGYSRATVRKYLDRASAGQLQAEGLTCPDPDRVSGLQRGRPSCARAGESLAGLGQGLKVRRGGQTPAEDVQRMVSLYQEGRGVSDIAGLVGCHSETVRKYLKAAGVYRRPGFRLSAEDVQRIEDLYYRVDSLTEIAAITGLNDSAIQYHLTKRGLHTPERRVSPPVALKIVKWYQRGVTIRVIADRTGFSRSTINYHLQRSSAVRLKKVVVTPEDVQLMIKLWGQGLNLTRIAKTLSLSRTTVRKYLTATGVYDPDRPWGINDPRHPDYKGTWAGGSSKSVAFGGWEVVKVK